MSNNDGTAVADPQRIAYEANTKMIEDALKELRIRAKDRSQNGENTGIEIRLRVLSDLFRPTVQQVYDFVNGRTESNETICAADFGNQGNGRDNTAQLNRLGFQKWGDLMKEYLLHKYFEIWLGTPSQGFTKPTVKKIIERLRSSTATFFKDDTLTEDEFCN